MRIFVHNVDTFLGRVLVKELRKADGGFHRIFGSASSDPSKLPSVVKRVVSRDDPKKAKKMAETIQSCKLVVIDLFNSTLEDIHFMITSLKVDPKTNPPRQLGELESDVTVVLVSSVMVWASTSSDGGPLKEEMYQQRTPAPGSKYVQWKEMEDLVMSCFNREGSQVRGFVVAGGVLYGEGEETFRQLLKDAWLGEPGAHAIHDPGTNHIPTVHVRDLARLVRHLGFYGDGINPEETPYFLAVDQPPMGEGEPSKPSSQAQIMQGIVDELSGNYHVPTATRDEEREDAAAAAEAEVEEEARDGCQKDLREALGLDLWMEASSLMLDPVFASTSEPPGWCCKDGLLANLRSVADEFCRERRLSAIRVIVSGPPASGKSALAARVSEHFNIPHLSLDPENLSETAGILESKVCRYRGYVLDAGSAGFQEVERLFRSDFELPPAEDEEAEAAAGGGDPDDEGGTEQPPAKKVERRLNQDLCPTFVVLMQAPEPLCRARWLCRDGGTVEEFDASMKKYKAVNLDDDVLSLADFFQDVAGQGVFNLPAVGKDEEELFESTRIYIEKAGRPFNYLRTAEEVAEEGFARRRAQEAAAVERAATEVQRQVSRTTDQAEEDSKRHIERMRIISAHEQERRELEALPLREYLMRHTVPHLTEGLIEMCKVLPDDPVDYLANYLENHATNTDVEN